METNTQIIEETLNFQFKELKSLILNEDYHLDDVRDAIYNWDNVIDYFELEKGTELYQHTRERQCDMWGALIEFHREVIKAEKTYRATIYAITNNCTF